MKEEYKSLIIRYLLIVLVALPNLYIFYFIFTPLTIYTLYFILNIFSDVTLTGNFLLFTDFSIEIIPACVAGSAYYLLFFLNLSIPNISLKKRANMLLFSFLLLLLFANILRILFLILLLFYGAFLFNLTHKLFWYLLSTFFVVLIWFLETKLFKIKEIPIYTDILSLYKKSIFKKTRR